jgi:hypothetical protein
VQHYAIRSDAHGRVATDFPRISSTTRGVTFVLMTHELPHRVGEPLQGIFGKLLGAGCCLGSSSLRPSSVEKPEVLRATSVP